MAARGAIAKEAIIKKILETFSGSFVHAKEVRIPFEENGENLQIKLNLTCAKVNVENNESGGASSVASSELVTPAQKVEVTEEERNNVKKLMEGLGL